MLEPIVSITREDLDSFQVKLLADINESQDAKLDEKLKSFEERIKPQGALDPNEAMGKTLAGLRFGAKSKYADFVKTLAPQNETTAADGGTLVPDVTRPEILRLMEEFGVGRSDFRVLPMGVSKVVKIPRKLTGATVTRTSENTAITDTKVTLDYVTLTASKVAAIVAMSNELDEDSIVDMGQYVNELLGESFAEEEDGQFYAGTGSPHTGLFNTTSTYGKEVQVASAADISYDDLVSVVYGIKSNYLLNAVWRMHRTVYAEICKIKDLQDRPIVVNPAEPTKASMFGYPIRLIESAPNADTATAGMPLIILGAGKNAIIGSKRDLTVKILTEATVDSVNLAENDLVGIRVTKRDAFTVALPSAYSVIKITE
jgi:HK97 family phage major capsid protein